MLRTLALVLLLANALLLAALTGVFDGGAAKGEREPERLQRQHQPGLVRVLPPQAASAALAAAGAEAAAASSAQALACLEAGPFSATDAETAERFRSMLLSTGNESDRIEAYRAFRGRDPDVKYIMQKRGFPLPAETAK